MVEHRLAKARVASRIVFRSSKSTALPSGDAFIAKKPRTDSLRKQVKTDILILRDSAILSDGEVANAVVCKTIHRFESVPPSMCAGGGIGNARDLKSLGGNTVPVRPGLAPSLS